MTNVAAALESVNICLQNIFGRRVCHPRERAFSLSEASWSGYPSSPTSLIASVHAGVRNCECTVSVQYLYFQITYGQNLEHKALSSGAGEADCTASASTMFRYFDLAARSDVTRVFGSQEPKTGPVSMA